MEANSDEVMVVITVTDVNEAPEVAGDAAVNFDEVAGDIATPLDTYTGTDEDGDDTGVDTWSVAGADGGEFEIVAGALMFKEKPDYEMPTDANRDNVYEVTVQASDGMLTDTFEVKVTVVNENEDGMVTMSRTQPRVGFPVTVSLADPDGSVSGLTWQWSRSTNATNNFAEIDGATSNTYTPVTVDASPGRMYLRATASYTDGEGPEKTAMGTSANPADVDTRNQPPEFGDEDPDTEGDQNAMATRTVEENTDADATDDSTAANSAAGDDVGGPVSATDPDPNVDPLIYTLSGADAALFRVRQDNPDTNNANEGGQIEVGAGTELDYETRTPTW